MKKLILFLVLGLSIIDLAAHCKKETCQNEPDKEKYSKVWEYIRKDSVNIDKTIYIFDSIADLDKQWFREDINAALGENKTAEDYLKFEWEKNKYSPTLASLFPYNKGVFSDKILIFSGIDDNMILVELWDRKRHPEQWDYVRRVKTTVDTHTTISWAGRFTQGYLYLFIFDDDGSIKHVFRHFIETD